MIIPLKDVTLKLPMSKSSFTHFGKYMYYTFGIKLPLFEIFVLGIHVFKRLTKIMAILLFSVEICK